MTTDLIFRPAARADVPTIVRMLADDEIGAGREGDTNAYWTAFEQIAADPRSRLIVADLDGEVVGTLQLTFIAGLSRMGAERAQIESVRVAASCRGRGLGREMITWAIGQARERGCAVVQLTTDKRRSAAIRFYESLGFTSSHEGLKLLL